MLYPIKILRKVVFEGYEEMCENKFLLLMWDLVPPSIMIGKMKMSGRRRQVINSLVTGGLVQMI